MRLQSRNTLLLVALVLSACVTHKEKIGVPPPAPAAAEPARAAAAAAEPSARAGAPADADAHVETATAAAAPAAKAKHAGVRMPDPDLTPGKASYRTLDQICVKGSAKDERNVSESEKKTVYASYGIAKCEGYCSGPQGCEIDHLVSIELGGANTEDNLWPQPYDGDWNAHDKDRLENMLHTLVCNKTVKLKDAQKAIATDWVAAYKKYVGEDRKPFKPTIRCK